MRAVTVRDGAVVVDEHPDPSPQAGEILVRVRAAGLNGADVLQMKGGYPAPPGSPQDIPGLEFAGEVAELRRRRRTASSPATGSWPWSAAAARRS